MPGTASPRAFGRSISSRCTADAGTCPSRMWPLTSAVWHAARSGGTPRRFRTLGRSAASSTSTVNPASRKCCTQPEQQPQFGSLWTLIAVQRKRRGEPALPMLRQRSAQEGIVAQSGAHPCRPFLIGPSRSSCVSPNSKMKGLRTIRYSAIPRRTKWRVSADGRTSVTWVRPDSASQMRRKSDRSPAARISDNRRTRNLGPAAR